MKPKTLQLYTRGVGLILGVCGVAGIVMCFVTPKPPPLNSISTPRWFDSLILLILASAFLRAAYLAWFRWSPLAIRHVVGGVFFLITLLCLFYVPFHAPTGWGLFSFLAAFPVCYILYRLIAYSLSRYAFPPSSDATPLPNSRNA